MRGLLSRRPSPALVVAVVALVMATVGTGYAAFKVPKKSVGAKQLKKNAVTTAKIKKNAINGSKVKDQSLTGADINLGKLGTVPSAAVANTVPPREGMHLVGAAGEPGFESGWSNVPAEAGLSLQSVGFFKDHDDVVHLEGFAKNNGTEPFLFTLPAGFRPAEGRVQAYETLNETVLLIGGSNTRIGTIDISGKVIEITGEEGIVALSGITFRAQS